MKNKLINLKVSETEKKVLKDKAKAEMTDVSKLLLRPHLSDFDKAKREQ